MGIQPTVATKCGRAALLRISAILLVVSLVIVSCASRAWGASVHPLFDLSATQSSPFPSDRFTVPDPAQNTGLRVALPKPDCVARPSDCADIDVLNELDGFNLLPRLEIPFDGSIDLTTAISATIFLVSLGSTLPGGGPSGHVVGIDQVVWDPGVTTLDVESDELLDQHARYALVVTKDVHDPSGKEVKASKSFLDFVNDSVTTSTGDPLLDAYRSSLRGALDDLDARGIVSRGQIVAASVFTTLSASANLEKMRDQVKAGTPAPANFLLGTGGTRTVFPRSLLSGILFRRQVSADPTAPLSSIPLSVGAALNAVPGAVGRVAFGRYTSPDYRVHPGEYIPQVGTLTGIPAAQGSADITFVLFLPSTSEPAGGYPVVIYGHGGGTNKLASATVAAKLAESGLATIAIDQPGVGFGPRSAYTLTFTDGTSTTLLAGGRSIDQNGDGRITDGEGGNPAPPRAMLGSGRGDGLQQLAVDHMQLVRTIQVGMDVDGDGTPDLDPSRIYYVGPSGGGRRGTIFVAVEPDVRAGVLNVPASSVEERLSAPRGNYGPSLQSRVPPLINAPGVTAVDGITVPAPYFNENLPLRQGAPFRVTLEDGSTQTVRPPTVNTVSGALAIQQAMEWAEWAQQPGNSIAYAPYLRRHPLVGVPPKPVIVQIAYGDRMVPNPSTTAFIRAADLADRTTFFRNDLAFAVNPTPLSNPNQYPHVFLTIFPNEDPALVAIALQAQGQIASFFALDGPGHILDPFDGSQITDPDLDGPIFETPIHLPLPILLDYPLSSSLAALSPGATEPGDRPLGDRLARDSGPHLPASLSASPIPYRGGALDVSFVNDQPQAQAVLSIYDLAGRRVRRLDGGNLGQGGPRFTWDGRSDGGLIVAPGVYLLRAETGRQAAETKIVVLP